MLSSSPRVVVGAFAGLFLAVGSASAQLQNPQPPLGSIHLSASPDVVVSTLTLSPGQEADVYLIVEVDFEDLGEPASENLINGLRSFEVPLSFSPGLFVLDWENLVGVPEFIQSSQNGNQLEMGVLWGPVQGPFATETPLAVARVTLFALTPVVDAVVEFEPLPDDGTPITPHWSEKTIRCESTGDPTELVPCWHRFIVTGGLVVNPGVVSDDAHSMGAFKSRFD